MSASNLLIKACIVYFISSTLLHAQPPGKLIAENISQAIKEAWKNASVDSTRPG
jgi:hypothetical protein